MNKPISVVIADDHPLFRMGLRQAIEVDPALGIVGETGDGEAALQLLRSLAPDVAVLDIDMPGRNGLDVARAVQEGDLFVAVIILTIYKEEDMFIRAVDAGVRGYVMKESAVLDLLDAIKAVAEGRYYFSPSLTPHLVQRSRRAAQLLEVRPTLADLTPAERRILKLVAENKTSKEIAAELVVSYRTVETHRTNIASKLNIHGTHALLKFAIEHRSSL